MRAHSSFLNIEHEEQSKQHWKSQDLLRLDSRLCRCQMPSDEEVLAPGPSQKGRNWSIWRSYCVLGTAQCWMYLYLFVAWDLCGEYIVLLGGLGHWGSETQRRSDLLGQGLKAGMWLSRKGTQCQPVCFLVYLTVTFSLAWQAGGLLHTAARPPNSFTDCHPCRGFVKSSKFGAATTSQDNDTVWIKPTFLRKIFFNLQWSLRISLPITSLISTILTKCFCFFYLCGKLT